MILHDEIVYKNAPYRIYHSYHAKECVLMHLARVELKGSKSLIVQSVAIDGDDCEILGTMRREQAGLQPIDMHNFWQLFEDRAKELGIKQMHGYVPLELGEFYIRTYENVQAIEGECPYEGMIHLEINLW